MTPKLSDEQRQAVEQNHGGPVEVVDAKTHHQYVLIRAEMFERFKRVLELSEPSEEDTTALIQQIGKSAGWEDPSSDDLI